MNNTGLIVVLALVGVGAYWFISTQKPQQESKTSSTNGGVQGAASQDLFSSILTSIQQVAGTIKIAATNPKTT